MSYADCEYWSNIGLWIHLVMLVVLPPLAVYIVEFDGFDTLWDKWYKKSRKKVQRPSLTRTAYSQKQQCVPYGDECGWYSISNYPSPESFLESRSGMPQEAEHQDGILVVVG
mgnify:CR=1 FL=1